MNLNKNIYYKNGPDLELKNPSKSLKTITFLLSKGPHFIEGFYEEKNGSFFPKTVEGSDPLNIFDLLKNVFQI